MFEDALQWHQAGRIDDAVVRYKRVLLLKPDCVDAHNNLGVALAQLGRIEEAVAHYERALVLKPDSAGVISNLGAALVQLGRIDEAVKYYERALVLKPDNAGVLSNLGVALVHLGRIDEAVEYYERALVLKPDIAGVISNLGVALVHLGGIDEAVAHYERALVLNAGNANVHSNLAIALTQQDRIDEALTHYERALAIDPDHADAHNGLGNIFKVQGKFDLALYHYGSAIEVRPAYAEAHFSRAEIKIFHHRDDDLRALKALAERDDLPVNKAPFIHFALAKAFEDCADYARAFHHLRKGNDLKRRQIDYDESAEGKLFQRISAVFNSDLLHRFKGEGDPSSAPIFVLGMPRSGSTLVEQILASHPQIQGAGELKDLDTAVHSVSSDEGRPVQFPECITAFDGITLRRLGQSYIAGLPALAKGKVRITDKMPGNFLKIGLIRLILPNARIIHTMRDPLDTCLSCYSKLFTAGQRFSYDLAELGRYYCRYMELMAHWRSVVPLGRILDVSYEDVVDDLEGQSRRLIDYCGLSWDDGCLRFAENSRPVKTASAVQVRKPLFRSSLQRWRRYNADLTPLLRELGDIMPGRASVQSQGGGRLPGAPTDAV
jgi:tetratricopeptide (TPR) repeat protein